MLASLAQAMWLLCTVQEQRPTKHGDARSVIANIIELRPLDATASGSDKVPTKVDESENEHVHLKH